MGGRISMYFSNILSAMRHVTAGKLRALGVTSAKRSIVAPDVPTIAEAALPGYEAYNWYGVFVPKGTPKARIDVLHRRIVETLKDKAVHGRLVQSGAEVIGNTPVEFQKFIKTETEKYAQVVKEAGLKPH
jgi:tripartite-type tricarboxylate transporter receptor subunit TctC